MTKMTIKGGNGRGNKDSNRSGVNRSQSPGPGLLHCVVVKYPFITKPQDTALPLTMGPNYNN